MAHEFPHFVAHGTYGHGWALAMQDEGEGGMVQLHYGLAALLATGERVSQPIDLGLLVEAGARWPGRGGIVSASRGPSSLCSQRVGRHAGDGVSSLGRLAATPGRPGCVPGRSLLPAGPGYCPLSAGQILGA